ncbi:hypothetical protein JTB14_008352 [Gonioctena quinquepunctata]|nr:hypothetical protein JTB14_008352 [Gonioctena quinquepunctata]
MQKRCERKIPKSKYEYNVPEVEQWWLQIFEYLENHIRTKPERTLSVLKASLPSRILSEVLEVLGKRWQFVEEFEDSSTSDESDVAPERKSTRIANTGGSAIQASPLASQRKNLCLARAPEPNPYLEFFKRRPDRCAIWRELPALPLEEMSLNQIAKAITRLIAEDFVNWLAAIGGNHEPTINVRSIIEMFEIGFKMDNITTLSVSVNEMHSLPQSVAEAMGDPSLSKQSALRREVKRDKKASMLQPRHAAFGRRLDTESQIKPTNKKVVDKWLRGDKMSHKLETMAAVWQGITHLRSTKSFCEYLYNEHSEIVPPKFLEDAGMMDTEKITARSSISQTITFWQVTGLTIT